AAWPESRGSAAHPTAPTKTLATPLNPLPPKKIQQTRTLSYTKRTEGMGMTATMRLFDVARLVTGLLLAALVSACANLLGPPVVYGTVYSDDSMDLPSDARLEVRLVDPSGDGSGETIANVAVDDPGSAPIRFA